MDSHNFSTDFKVITELAETVSLLGKASTFVIIGMPITLSLWIRLVHTKYRDGWA